MLHKCVLVRILSLSLIKDIQLDGLVLPCFRFLELLKPFVELGRFTLSTKHNPVLMSVPKLKTSDSSQVNPAKLTQTPIEPLCIIEQGLFTGQIRLCEVCKGYLNVFLGLHVGK